MRVVIQQVDLDTCVTALVLGVSREDLVVVVRKRADQRDLDDPSVLCIEAGGSGRIAERNFDHHDADGPTAPACRQAFDAVRPGDPGLAALVDYAAAHDVTGCRRTGADESDTRLSLSSLFSGLRLAVRNPVDQFFAGLNLLRVLVGEGIDPGGSMPGRPEWREYVEAKRSVSRALEDARAHADTFATSSGLRAGYMESEVVGALGVVYGMDCDIAIAYSPRFRAPDGARSIPKYAIGGRNGVRVDHLLPLLNALEPGWGGPAHGTIIASPRDGSGLTPDVVKDIVTRNA